MTAARRPIRWNLGLAALATSWGLIAVLAGAVSIGAAPLAFLRLAIAALTLLLVAFGTGRLGVLAPGTYLLPLAAIGVAQAVHWWLFFETVKRGSVALAVLTFYASPIFLAVLGPLVLRERRSPVALGALLPAGVGIALVALAGEDGVALGPLAVACGVGSAFTFAVLVVLSKRLLGGGVAPLTVAFWDCLVGAAVLAPTLMLPGNMLPADAGEWAAVLVLGIGFTGLSTLAYAALLRHVTAQAAGVLTFLEPVSALALAWLLLGESLPAGGLLGAVLVIAAGVAVVLLEPAERVTESVAGVGSTASP